MEHCVRAESVSQLGHLGNGHDRAHLVVNHHNGYEDCVLPQCGLQSFGGNTAVLIGLQVSDIKTLGLQFFHAVEDGMMLNGGGNDVLATLAKTFDSAENSPVVCLGSTGGEEHPVRFCTHGDGHLVPRGTQSMGGVDAEVI